MHFAEPKDRNLQFVTAAESRRSNRRGAWGPNAPHSEPKPGDKTTYGGMQSKDNSRESEANRIGFKPLGLFF